MVIQGDAREFVRAQAQRHAELVASITLVLLGDERVNAAWLAGSAGRGEDDALSDIDVVLVMAPGYEAEMARQRFALASRVGPVALALDSPQNAPPDGAQVNVLYDLEPLPIFVDWSYWPPISERPSDVRVLFERDSADLITGRAYDEVTASLPPGTGLEGTPQRRADFALAMTPIIAKFALRGAEDDVARMFGYMREPPPERTDLKSTLDALDALTERLAELEPAKAIACVRRYLAMARQYGTALIGS